MTVVNLHSKGAGEARTVIVDFGDKLTSDELLLTADTVVELETADLTLSDLAITTVDHEFGGRIVKKSEGVQFTVSGGTAGTNYRIRITATTDAAVLQTVIATIGLAVYA